MNNWRDIKEEAPRADTIMLRVKYIYCVVSVPQWAEPFDIPFIDRINQKMLRKPIAAILSQHLGIGIVHIDPPRFDDNGVDLLSGGFRWSDLKGEYQRITHWMYVDEPYDESEETTDAVLLQDQDGNIKEATSITMQKFGKPNKMGRVYNAENITSVISKDPRFKKENNMKFVKTITKNVFALSKFEIGAAYLCTPSDTSKVSFIGIYKEGSPTVITFWVPSGTRTLTLDDIVNDCWTVEKMIEPMTEKELNFIHDLIIRNSLANGSEAKDITDSILKKLGFSVKVEFTPKE